MYTSAQAGDFNNINTWVGGVVPTSVDDVIVEHNVYVRFNTSIKNVTINSGGILRSNAASVNFTMTGNLNIQVGGEFRGIDIGNNLNLVFTGTSVFTNNGTASFKNLTVNGTLTLNSSIGGGLLNTSSININGTLNCQTNTIDLDALSIFNLNSGATLQTAVANGVQATIIGTGTENFNANASYIFSTGCTNTGFGSIAEVNNITLDAVTITNTTSFAMNGGFYRSATPNNFNVNGLSTTITLQGNSSSSPISGYVIRVDNLKVEGTHSSFGVLEIYQTLEIDPGASLVVSGGRDFNMGSGANII